jgi:Tfp pilus assembly protein PilF
MLYQIAFMQLDLKRYNEAMTNAEIVLKDGEAETRMMLFRKNNNQNQQVSLKATTFRLMALISEEKGDIDQAKEYYTKALELSPEFELALNERAKLN